MSKRGMPRTREIMVSRRKEAEERQAEYDKLTLQQKLDRLPPAPQGAKVRAKLMSGKNTKPGAGIQPGELTMIAADTSPKEDAKPSLKAKERRAQEKK